MYTITLANGKTISNVSLNGSVFTTTQPLTREDFSRGLKQVVISGTLPDENPAWTPGTYTNMRLSYFRDGDTKEFCLAFITETELEQMRQRADLEYVAMMAGVEL